MAGAWIGANLGHGSIRYALDSMDYRALSETSLDAQAVFSARRPPLYPLLLDAARVFDSGYAILPHLQYAIFFAATLALFTCLAKSGLEPWEALLLTAPIPGATVLEEYGDFMLTEAPAAAFAIVAVGLAYLIACRGPALSRNVLFGGAISAVCLIRPSYVFLVPALPFAIGLLSPTVRRDLGRRRVMRELGINFSSAAAFLLLYAGVRFAVVGHFGIVSYGGVAISGFGTNPAFLTRADLPKLRDAEMQGLARAVIDRRDSIAANPPADVPLYVFSEAELAKRPMLDAWFDAFDPAIWQVAVPAARVFYNASQENSLNPDWILINDRLGSLSLEMLKQKSALYSTWLVSGARMALQNVFHYEKAGRWGVGLAFLALLAAVGAHALKLMRRSIPFDLPLAAAAGVAALTLVLMSNVEGFTVLARTTVATVKGTVLGSLYPLFILYFALAVCAGNWILFASGRRKSKDAVVHRATAYAALALLYFLAGMILIVMVEVPGKRYLIGLSPLLPGAVLLLSVRMILALLSQTVVIRRYNAA